jgi:hypothetical protein
VALEMVDIYGLKIAIVLVFIHKMKKFTFDNLSFEPFSLITAVISNLFLHSIFETDENILNKYG